MIRVTGQASPLHVYDINGTEVLTVETPADGDTFLLPSGVYVAVSEGMKPCKIVI